MTSNPITTHYDALVLGGGMIGLGAAFTLAQNGQKVLVIERRPMPGWEITAGFIGSLPRTKSPAVRLVHRAFNGMAGMLEDRVDPPVAELTLDRMLEDYGIDLLLFSQATGLTTCGEKAVSVKVGNKGGEQEFGADVMIDATEEGILWKATGMKERAGASIPLRQALYLNLASPGLELPLELGDVGELHDLTLFRSVRSREVAAEFTVKEGNITSARKAAETAIGVIRQRVPELANALVSHVGIEPMPLDAHGFEQYDGRHPWIENLYSAGLWTVADGKCRHEHAFPAGRIELGECTARAVLQRGTAERFSAGPNANSEKQWPQTDPVRECEILVAGGGTAGVMAAIAAGRQGAKVIMLEASTFAGGMVTGSGQDYGGHGVRGGLQDEFHAKVKATIPDYAGKGGLRRVHPEPARVVLDTMLRDAGVEVVYSACAVSAIKEKNRVTGVVAATPSGRTEFRSKVVIDSTGDADVARMAGSPMRIGRDVDHVLHCYSQVCYLMENGDTLHAINHDSGYTDPVDPIDLTRARREGIRQIRERFAPTMEGERPLVTISPLVGLRQGPLIIGDYAQDFLEQILPVHFEDCIGYSAAKYDCHSQDFENQHDAPVLWVWMLGNRERHIGQEIPYRCMLPRGLENILVACRSASTTNETNYQFRTIRNMHRIGEAAGISAALCVRDGITPREIEVKRIQAELHKSGGLGDAVRPKVIVPPQSLEELPALLSTKDPKDAVWLLAHGGEKGRRLLLEALNSDSAGARFWASVALAWHEDEAALPELIHAVETRLAERPDYTPRSRNMVPLWQSCIVMLGRIGSPEAVPVLFEVLEDPSINMDVMIAAVRALGRISDKRAVPVLLELLERDDLPRDRRFQQTNKSSRWPVSEDGLWQVELAIAEVLKEFGRPQPRVVEKHLHDPRNWVRRYAEKVQEGGERSSSSRKRKITESGESRRDNSRLRI